MKFWVYIVNAITPFIDLLRLYCFNIIWVMLNQNALTAYYGKIVKNNSLIYHADFWDCRTKCMLIAAE